MIVFFPVTVFLGCSASKRREAVEVITAAAEKICEPQINVREGVVQLLLPTREHYIRLLDSIRFSRRVYRMTFLTV